MGRKAGEKSIWQKTRKVFLRIMGVLFSLIALAVACFSLIMAYSKPEESSSPSPQPLLTPSPALNISEESDLHSLIASFPIPVMSFMSGSGLRFVSAASADTALENGFARVASLYWQTEDGQPLILRSIYPASAFSLLEKDFHFTPVSGPSLFGNASVRMENDQIIRIHVKTEKGLYAVNCPKALADRLTAITRSLQLYEVGDDSSPAG